MLISLHRYWAQVFILPKGVLDEVTKICRDFLWSGKAYSHKLVSIAWENLCWSKASGGLGFRDVVTWNIACLGKYIWAIVAKQDNVWIRWIHSMYIKGDN